MPEGAFGRPSILDITSGPLTFSRPRNSAYFCLLGLKIIEAGPPLLNECNLPTVYLGNVIGIIGGALYYCTYFPAYWCFLLSLCEVYITDITLLDYNCILNLLCLVVLWL